MNDNVSSSIEKLAQGNPGALSVLCDMLCKYGPVFMDIYNILNIENIKGPAIWIGYKDYCKEDLDVFSGRCVVGDQKMFEFIRKEMGG